MTSKIWDMPWVRGICTYCGHPSKYIAGLWDGVDRRGRPVGGCDWKCESVRCPIARRRRKLEQERAVERQAVQEANRRAGVDVRRFREIRIQRRLLIHDVADLAGVSSATISGYENQRIPFPPELYAWMLEQMVHVDVEGTDRT